MIERTFHVGGLTSMKKVFAKNATDQNVFLIFLAHLWCAYAMVLCLSWIVRRAVGCVCVEHNYPKMWMD